MDRTDQKIDTPVTSRGSGPVRYEIIDKDGNFQISHMRLLELLDYDRETGLFHWKVAKNNRFKAGRLAGSLARGYISIEIDEQAYRAHNLAWFYVTGKWPDPEIDHRDTNKANNAFLNLREATRTQQCANQPTRRDNKLGVKGVCAYRDGKRYVSQIRIAGKTKHLGLFETAQEAARAYERAAIDAWGDFARASPEEQDPDRTGKGWDVQVVGAE